MFSKNYAPLQNTSVLWCAAALLAAISGIGFRMGAPPSKLHDSAEAENHTSSREIKVRSSFTEVETTGTLISQKSSIQDQTSPGDWKISASSPAPANTPPSQTIPSGVQSLSRNRHATKQLKQPSLPLVMVEMDMNALGLSPEQQALVSNLRNQFITDIGGYNQNPASPEYLNRWLAAAASADEILRSQIGWQAFNAYTIAGARVSMQAR